MSNSSLININIILKLTVMGAVIVGIPLGLFAYGDMMNGFDSLMGTHLHPGDSYKTAGWIIIIIYVIIGVGYLIYKIAESRDNGW